MKLKDWLLDLVENNRVDLIDGEVVILPIQEDDENVDSQKS